MWFFILFYLSFILRKSETASDVIEVKEVSAGHLAELPCLSIDEYHRFMMWQFGNNDQLIGPGNPFNEKKYNYEVLTGTLQIRVSFQIFYHSYFRFFFFRKYFYIMFIGCFNSRIWLL